MNVAVKKLWSNSEGNFEKFLKIIVKKSSKLVKKILRNILVRISGKI